MRPAHNATAVIVDELSRNTNVKKEAEYKCPECRSIGSKSCGSKHTLNASVAFALNTIKYSYPLFVVMALHFMYKNKNTSALTQHV